MNRGRTIAIVAVLLCAWQAPVLAAARTIADLTRGLEKRDGFLPLYWDAAKGRVLVEVPNLDEPFLYMTSMATGLGDVRVSLDLDRGATGTTALGRFERAGNRLLLVIRNARFQSIGGSADLARTVEESFVTSTLGSFEVIGEEKGRVLADLTPLFLSDAIDVRGILKAAGQGNWQLDRERSRIHPARTRAFPRNTEVEAALTFTSDEPGARVREHAPDGRAITLREHHSFVKLPDPGYRPRVFDPRAGLFSVSFYDFAQPFDRDPVRRFIVRHRLVKRDSLAAVSEPVTPIVYYLDPGVPEPYRSAFREGASWWNRVFEAAGFRNAFRVEDMPADMDPMDARYNVIQWLHRSEPGASVGPTFVDPRTGEIIKAAVRMDSYRSRVDYDLFAAMLPAIGADAGDAQPLLEQLIVARRRQHAAHEVGHTLGFSHNFAAAADGRASVMAYPAPLVRLDHGRVDLSDAYRDGPGAWDSLMIRFAYTQFPAGGEEAGTRAILAELEQSGLRFVTNPDEGPDGSYPEGTPWVNGTDAVAELQRVLELRRVLIDRFDARAIRPGEPMALLGRRFAQVYLYHQYTLGAAIKAIGGMEFEYGVRGDPRPPTRVVSAARQRRALELALDCLEPRELEVPARVAALIAPTPFGYDPDERGFQSAADPAFDPGEAARAVADDALDRIFAPARAARVADFAAQDSTLPSLEDVIARVIERSWRAAPESHAATLRRIVQRSLCDALLKLAANPAATPRVRAAAEWGLAAIARRVGGTAPARATPAELAHRAAVRGDIQRFMERRTEPMVRSAPPVLPARPWPALAGCSY
jgi:hypothetical protein